MDGGTPGLDRLVERVVARIKLNDNGCWVWQGAKKGPDASSGYGLIGQGRAKLHYTHRIMFEAFNGPIPKGGVVCHACDNPSCCSPEHLWLGDAKENGRDMSRKGRGTSPLSPEQVREIRRLLGHEVNQNYIAAYFNVTQATVSNIHLRNTWDSLE